MSNIIMFININNNNNIFNNIIFNFINTIKKKNFCFIKPILKKKKKKRKKNKNYKFNNFYILYSKTLNIKYSKHLLFFKNKDILIQELISYYYKNINKYDFFIIEGLSLINNNQNFIFLNYEISQALNSKIVIPLNFNKFIAFKNIKKYVNLIYNYFNYYINLKINSFIINFFNIKNHNKNFLEIKQNFYPTIYYTPLISNSIYLNIINIAYYVKSNILNKGKIFNIYIKNILFYENNIIYISKYFYSNTLIIISLNNINNIFKICLYILNGININAIILTNVNKSILYIKTKINCLLFFNLPIFIINKTIIEIFNILNNFNIKNIYYNYYYIKKKKKNIKFDVFKQIKYISKNIKFSSQEFIYKITELSKQANKRIILPESYEPRIIKAASICYKQNIARCVLLGNPDKINNIALLNNIKLSKNIEIINPDKIRNNYINNLIKLRKHKGMNEFKAIKALKDNVVLGTMMLKENKIDGLLSGSVNTTANTIRPAFQIIKTSPGVNLISSIFFMLLPEQVLIYGDCAININPNAEQLAEIAIESANSAILFDIKPKIAMISYSTGNSGKGIDVEKVKIATNLVIKKRPDLIIDGPLQYDAATIPNVSKLKSPFSKVNGEANILIFPDLNTGNTTYKAVQRSANIISIGPMLQGINKPVNDLSRGALINDIIYTIAITSIQATKKII